MGSKSRKLRRAAGLTGYEYQRDLKRAAQARRRADRVLGLLAADGRELALGQLTPAQVMGVDPGAGPDRTTVATFSSAGQSLTVREQPRTYDAERIELTIDDRPYPSLDEACRDPSVPLLPAKPLPVGVDAEVMAKPRPRRLPAMSTILLMGLLLGGGLVGKGRVDG